MLPDFSTRQSPPPHVATAARMPDLKHVPCSQPLSTNDAMPEVEFPERGGQELAFA